MTELEYAEKRMQQKWYDLVLAEQQGSPMQALERCYTAYMLAVETYNRCVAEQQDQPLFVPSKQAKKVRKKAS